jgi:hypothetical protein
LPQQESGGSLEGLATDMDAKSVRLPEPPEYLLRLSLADYQIIHPSVCYKRKEG